MFRIDFFPSGTSAAGNSNEYEWKGGDGVLSAEAGTWGGASVKLQSKGPNGSWIDVTGVSLSANGFAGFSATRGAGLRTVVTGTPTGLYASAGVI